MPSEIKFHNTISSFVQHYVNLAKHKSTSSKLEAAKAFHKFAKQRPSRLAQKDLLLLIITLCQHETLAISVESCHAIYELAHYAEFGRVLVVECNIVKVLARLLSHHSPKMQRIVARCLGKIGSYSFACRRMISQGALMPLNAILNRRDGDFLVLGEICLALSMIYISTDLGIRIISIFGLKALRDIVLEYKMKNEYDELVLNAAKVWINFSKNEKISYEMVNSCDLFFHVESLLQHPNAQIRQTAAEITFNLADHPLIRDDYCKNDIVDTMLSLSSETTYEVKHFVAKAINTLMTEGKPSDQSRIKGKMMKTTNISLIEWMMKSIGCYACQSTALEALIRGDFIKSENQDKFSSDFLGNLVKLWKSTINSKVQKMCSEGIYHFALISAFHPALMATECPETLISQLSHKDIETRLWAVKSLAKLGDSNNSDKLMNLGLGSSVVTLFSLIPSKNMSPMDLDILLNASKIISALATENTQFRVDFQSQTNHMLSIFDHIFEENQELHSPKMFKRKLKSPKKQEQKSTDPFHKIISPSYYRRKRDLGLWHHDSVIYGIVWNILRVLKAYVQSANREGSGNACLRLISERRLIKLLAIIKLDKEKLYDIGIEIFRSYIRHRNIPMDIDKKVFWNLVICHGLLIRVRYDDDYLKFLELRTNSLQFCNLLLKNHAILDEINFKELLHHYLCLMSRAPKYIEMRLVTAKGLAHLCKQKQKLVTDFLIQNFDYCKELGVEVNSTAELFPSFTSFLEDYIKTYEQDRQKNRAKTMKNYQTLRDNLGPDREENSSDDDVPMKYFARKKVPKLDEFHLLRKWEEEQPQFAGKMPELLDLPPQKYKMRLKKAMKIKEVDKKIARYYTHHSYSQGLLTTDFNEKDFEDPRP